MTPLAQLIPAKDLEPLILLPGMMCDARLFAPQIALFSGVRAVHCAPIGQADNMADIARDVLANAPPYFALAGLSMGGIVAMEIVRQAPERVRRLCLMDTNHRAETAERQALREPQIDAVRGGQLYSVMRDEMKPNYLVDSDRKPAILDTCMDMAEALGAGIFENQSRALQKRRDQTDTLKSFTGQTLVLCGRHDLLCPVSRHEEMRALLPNAALAVIENAGHLPTLEQPDATNGFMTHWLNN
ncbi:MAG: alpha/beta fold hydrolase [Pseudomonadota bacterium]